MASEKTSDATSPINQDGFVQRQRGDQLQFPDSWAMGSPPESPERVTATDVNGKQTPVEKRKQKVAWPGMSDKRWEQFDEDLQGIFQTSLQGGVERKLSALSTIVYALGKE